MNFFTERRIISDINVQHDIGSAQQVKSPKYSICAHQTKERICAPDQKINIALFNNLDIPNYHVEINGLRNPRDSLLINHEQNDYIEQYKDVKLFFKEYIGEPILNTFVTYPDMKTKYPLGIIDLGHQPDHLTPKKNSTISRIWR